MKKVKKALCASLLLGAITTGVVVPFLLQTNQITQATNNTNQYSLVKMNNNQTQDDENKPETEDSDLENVGFVSQTDRFFKKYFVLVIAIGVSAIFIIIFLAIGVEIWYRKKNASKEYLPEF